LSDAHARLIGFEELGQTDQFTTAMLEFRLKQTGKWSTPWHPESADV